MISLSGKRILVTGGSRGIGRATALLFARGGADVGVMLLTRDVPMPMRLAREIRALGRRTYVGGRRLCRRRGSRGADLRRGEGRVRRTRWLRRESWRVAHGGYSAREDGSGALARDDANQSRRRISDHARCARPHGSGRADGDGRQHRGAAWRGLSFRLRRDKGRDDLAREIARDRMCPGDHCQLRRTRIWARYRDVRGRLRR